MVLSAGVEPAGEQGLSLPRLPVAPRQYMAPLPRLERGAFRVGGGRSIHLSYKGIWRQRAESNRRSQGCSLLPCLLATLSNGPSGAVRTPDLVLPKHAPCQLGYTRIWSWISDSNRSPRHYEDRVLPTELIQRMAAADGVEPSFPGSEPDVLPMYYAAIWRLVEGSNL